MRIGTSALVARLPPKEYPAWAAHGLREFVREEGAVIFAEAQAVLSETKWMGSRFPAYPHDGIDLHHLRAARRALLETGDLIEDTVTFRSGRSVAALIDGRALASRGRKTQVRETAAHKRRIYHRYLGWSGRSELCGKVAEHVVVASMQNAAGLIVDDARAGEVREIEGQPITEGGPLDAAGFVVPNLARPRSTPLVPIAVEVKNIRQIVYPSSAETWDLLAKLHDFPDVVPVLVTRRPHPTLYKLFGDVGAVVVWAARQWFSDKIDADAFVETMGALNFRDAAREPSPARASATVTAFFGPKLRSTRPDSSEPLVLRQQRRWTEACQVVAVFRDLRDVGEEDRAARFDEFRDAMRNAGLYGGGW